MKVEDRLPGLGVGVDHGSEAGTVDPLLFRDTGSHLKQVSEHRLFTRKLRVQRSDVLARNDEEVNRRLGMDVFERHTLIVLVQYLRVGLPRGDAAEDTPEHSGHHPLIDLIQKPLRGEWQHGSGVSPNLGISLAHALDHRSKSG